MNINKKGFTLIEIVAIIILLSIIALLTYPVINSLIGSSREDLYDKQINELVRLSNAWLAGNAIDLNAKEGFVYDLSFKELAEQGYIVEEDIKNPKTGEMLPGCMKVAYNSANLNYDISYDEECKVEAVDKTPIISLSVDDGIINSSGYATNDFYVKVKGFNITSYKYCLGTNECEPIKSVNGSSGNIEINEEGTTYVCVIGKKGSKSTDKLCKNYKLDKTELVMGTLVIDGTLGENGWYISDVNLGVKDVAGVTSTLNINKITNDTVGTEVIMTSSTKSGKTAIKKYIIKVDKTAPIVGTLNINGTKGIDEWYLSDVILTVNNGSDVTSGHDLTTSSHTSITANTAGTEVVVTTKDKAGNTSTKKYIVKVNKDTPTEGKLLVDGKLGENGWYISDVKLGVEDVAGVTSTLNINEINEDTKGTEIIMTSINNTTGASKTTKYTIKVDKTKPTPGALTINGNKGDNGWYISDVTLTLGDGTDNTSGIESNTSNISEIKTDTSGTKVIVTTKDKAGNVATSEHIIKVDKTAPTPGTLTINGTKGIGEWYLSDVTLTVNDGSDATSGHVSTTSTHTSITGNTSGTEVVVTTKDKAGNTSTRKYTIRIDKNEPTAGTLVIDGTLGNNGWYVSDVNLSVNDVEGVTSTLNITKLTEDTAGTNVVMTSKNNTTGAVKVTNHTIKVDKTKPTIGTLVISGTKGDNGWYKSDVTFSVTNGSDSMSGHASTTSSITSITKDTTGTKVVVTTKDKAGNTSTKEYTVKVDKTAPTPGTITVNGTKGIGEWYLSDVTLTVNNGSDATSGHASTTSTHTSITGNTSGTEVVVTTKDKAGNTATRKYTIKIDKNEPTAGTLVIDGTLGNNGWYVSDVNLSVSDVEGITSTLNITKITEDTAGTNVVMTSKNNTTGAVKVTNYTVKVDKTKPTIGTLVISGTKGDNGWYKSDVTFSVTNGSDSMSGHASTTSSITSITKDTTGTKVTLTTKDKAGNTVTKVQTIKMDKTAPTAGTATFTGTLGSNSWYTTNVTVNVTNGSDSMSGHASTTSSITSITKDTTGTKVTLTTKDKAGNSSTRKYTIKVDKTTPTLTAKGSSYSIIKGVNNTVSTTYFNTPTYGISGGSISCSPTTTGSLAVGTHTLTCTATGGNGLKKQATTSLTVKSPIYADNSGANKPVLYNNMVPIKYENNKWIVADLSEKWYDYDAKQWANAVVLNPGLTKAVGQEVTEEEVSLWYVWIPRYKYTIFNGNNGSAAAQLINVTFESGTARTGTVTCTDNFSTNNQSEVCTDSTNGSIKNGTSTYTHPAFKFGNTELTGFWVGKFEVSGSTSAITIKPNVSSLRGQTLSSFFTIIQNAKTKYGISNADSHMIKNMEWGAVAYLKQSKYGLGTTDIAINTNSSYYTGGGTGDAYKTNAAQSTTGNVYGVYDMSGGSNEFVMGNMKSKTNAFYPNESGFTTAPDAKYYDSYKYGSTDTSHARGKLGDATKETLTAFGNNTSGWYSDRAFLPSDIYAWFIRGGRFNDGSYAGVFSFNFDEGGGYYSGDHTTRAVLSAQ